MLNFGAEKNEYPHNLRICVLKLHILDKYVLKLHILDSAGWCTNDITFTLCDKIVCGLNLLLHNNTYLLINVFL